MEFKFYVKSRLRFSKPLDTKPCAFNNCPLLVTIGLPYCPQHMRTECRLELRPSTVPGAGLGLFAVGQGFQPGEFIAQYTGDILDKRELERRYGKYTAPYAILLKKNVCIDSATHRSIASLVNHRPVSLVNSRFKWLYMRNPQGIELCATKRIQNGEEIFVNYGPNYRLHEKNSSYTTS